MPNPSHPDYRAVFLDRDGVINQIILRKGKVCSPRTLGEFCWEEGVREALQRLKENGFLLIVVTNQPDVARRRMPRAALRAMTDRIYATLPVDAVFVCPHDDHHRCDCRKPKPGMLFKAGQTWNIDYRRSYMVGDSWKDMQAGETAGCRTILLDRFYNPEVKSHYRVANLADAVRVILNHPA
jgi:D-glycero-D-manno-heptose 1,7-bisphosphate phosphatase